MRQPQARAAGSFASLEQRLTTYICYAQVFGTALTLPDLVARCGPVRTRRVRSTLGALIAGRRVVEEGGFYFLPGWSLHDYAARTEQRQHLAERILTENHRFLAAVERFPFVRLVAISGSVAAANPVPTGNTGPDCDLFIITEDGSLHIVRLALRLFMKAGDLAPWLGLMSRTHRPCPNFMVEESASEIENESLYTATESVQVRVVKGQDAYEGFLRRNPWIGRYYMGSWSVGRDAGNGADRRHPRRAGLAREAVNLACFAVMCAGSWVKSRVLGTTFSYSLRSDPAAEKSLRRSRPGAGGYQVRVRNRFAELYRTHFSHLCSDEHLEFLFPRTSESGIWVNGRLFPAPLRSLDQYDGLLSPGR